MLVPHAYGNAAMPVFVAALALPRLRIASGIYLVADTGCDATMLHPIDSRRWLPSSIELEYSEEVRGIIGRGRYALEPGELTFVDEQERRVTVPLLFRIARPDGQNQAIPSLLGRDVLSQFRFVMDIPANELYLD